MPLTLFSIIACAVTFLLCGIPFGLVIARAKGVDVRKVGSGNIGTTNVARSVGKGAAALTLACDLGKGLVCIGAFRLLAPVVTGVDPAALGIHGEYSLIVSLVFMAAVCGHVFSPFLGFHGGKGIAVGFGTALGLCWQAGLGALLAFLLVAVPTRYVSAGSIAAAVAITVLCAAMGFSPAALAPVACVSAIVIWAHRSNIRKLLNHEESKFSFHRPKGGDDK